MTTGSWVMLAGGLLLLAWSTRQRLGRSSGAREWVGQETHERAVLVLHPALGGVLVLAGLLPLSEDSTGLRLVMGLVLVLLLVAALGWGIVKLPLPGWSVPRWYRERTAYRARAKRADD
ncbi:MAG: hypothetical protein ACRDYU_10615 [Actinomycetes bacterium]